MSKHNAVACLVMAAFAMFATQAANAWQSAAIMRAIRVVR